jgi:hypothetical protein
MYEGESMQLTPVMTALQYSLSVPETVEFFRRYYSPTQRAFAALPEDKQSSLRRDLEHFWAQHNQATNGTTHVEAEYLEVVRQVRVMRLYPASAAVQNPREKTTPR